jgi:hypothetical protein
MPSSDGGNDLIGDRVSASGKLVRSSWWKSGPPKGQRPRGSECCVIAGDSGCGAYTASAWGVGLSLVRSDVAGADYSVRIALPAGEAPV